MNIAAQTFAELQFKPHPNWQGVQAKVFYPNGYGASIIRSDVSYGGYKGLYELGVTAYDAGKRRLCYDTEITEDVLGHLTEDDVTNLLARIAALPTRGKRSA